MQDPQLCWCWQTYVHCVTAWMTTCLLSVEQLDTAGHVIVLFKHFIPSIFSCLCIVQKHLAQTCCSITHADSQTFYQRYVFNGKTHSLQTRKYDVSMTSLVAKNIQLLYWWNTCFLLKISWNFCGNLNIFHRYIKQNVSGCFFLNTVYNRSTYDSGRWNRWLCLMLGTFTCMGCMFDPILQVTLCNSEMGCREDLCVPCSFFVLNSKSSSFFIWLCRCVRLCLALEMLK